MKNIIGKVLVELDFIIFVFCIIGEKQIFRYLDDKDYIGKGSINFTL